MKSTRQGRVFVRNILAGIIAQTDEGYQFTYDPMYLQTPWKCTHQPYHASSGSSLSKHNVLPPFFDGLIPEAGSWSKHAVIGNWTEETGWDCCSMYVVIVWDLYQLRRYCETLSLLWANFR